MKKSNEQVDLRALLTSRKTIVHPTEVSSELDYADLIRLAVEIGRGPGADDVFQFVFIKEGAQDATVLTIEETQSRFTDFSGPMVKSLLDFVRRDIN